MFLIYVKIVYELKLDREKSAMKIMLNNIEEIKKFIDSQKINNEDNIIELVNDILQNTPAYNLDELKMFFDALLERDMETYQIIKNDYLLQNKILDQVLVNVIQKEYKNLSSTYINLTGKLGILKYLLIDKNIGNHNIPNASNYILLDSLQYDFVIDIIEEKYTSLSRGIAYIHPLANVLKNEFFEQDKLDKAINKANRIYKLIPELIYIKDNANITYLEKVLNDKNITALNWLKNQKDFVKNLDNKDLIRVFVLNSFYNSVDDKISKEIMSDKRFNEAVNQVTSYMPGEKDKIAVHYLLNDFNLNTGIDFLYSREASWNFKNIFRELVLATYDKVNIIDKETLYLPGMSLAAKKGGMQDFTEMKMKYLFADNFKNLFYNYNKTLNAFDVANSLNKLEMLYSFMPEALEESLKRKDDNSSFYKIVLNLFSRDNDQDKKNKKEYFSEASASFINRLIIEHKNINYRETLKGKENITLIELLSKNKEIINVLLKEAPHAFKENTVYIHDMLLKSDKGMIKKLVTTKSLNYKPNTLNLVERTPLQYMAFDYFTKRGVKSSTKDIDNIKLIISRGENPFLPIKGYSENAIDVFVRDYFKSINQKNAIVSYEKEEQAKNFIDTLITEGRNITTQEMPLSLTSSRFYAEYVLNNHQNISEIDTLVKNKIDKLNLLINLFSFNHMVANNIEKQGNEYIYYESFTKKRYLSNIEPFLKIIDHYKETIKENSDFLIEAIVKVEDSIVPQFMKNYYQNAVTPFYSLIEKEYLSKNAFKEVDSENILNKKRRL